MSERSDIRVCYTQSGHPRYVIEITHKQLNKYKAIKGPDPSEVERSALSIAAQWDDAWTRRLQTQQRANDRLTAKEQVRERIEQAREKTEEAARAIKTLNEILLHTLSVNDVVDWNRLKNRSDYHVAKPFKPTLPPKPARRIMPPEPQSFDPTYQVKRTLLDYLIPRRYSRRKKRQREKYLSDLARYKEFEAATIEKTIADIRAYDQAVLALQDQYEASIPQWEKERAQYVHERDVQNATIDRRRDQYLQRVPDAILDYCEIVLENSQYPEAFPKQFDLQFEPTAKILIVDYQLPSPDDIPTLVEVRYVQSRDEHTESHMTAAQQKKLYDHVVYQVVIRTLHELFEADVGNGLASVVFNGFVHTVDRRTGRDVDACIVSVHATKEDFLGLRLERIDPKACFKKLKGVGSSSLHSLAAVAPVVAMNKEDRRFIESYSVSGTLNEGVNVASMDWQDFEHLIRELFERELADDRAEVKVTQASRDGGVDAVVFNPDPIHGGKTIIQAKRYTNVVGVAAVRDLYGTVINEGANKGILVTTASYGPDAYEFAKDKPITLIDGSNLLHLLLKHGHKAYIDLREAKKALSCEQEER